MISLLGSPSPQGVHVDSHLEQQCDTYARQIRLATEIQKTHGSYHAGEMTDPISQVLETYKKFLINGQGSRTLISLPTTIVSSLESLTILLEQYRNQRTKEADDRSYLASLKHQVAAGFSRTTSIATNGHFAEHTTGLLTSINLLIKAYQEKFPSIDPRIPYGAPSDTPLEDRVALQLETAACYRNCRDLLEQFTSGAVITKVEGQYLVNSRSLTEILNLFAKALPVKEGFGERDPRALHASIVGILNRFETSLNTFVQKRDANKGWGSSLSSLTSKAVRTVTSQQKEEHSKDLLERIKKLRATPGLPIAE